MQPDGRIVLVKQANAAIFDDEAEEDIAQPLDSKIALSLPKGPVLGSAEAPLTLYEFSSFGCTHCSDFHLGTLPKLEADYIKSGKLKVIFVNFPLDRKSMQGAMISRCIPAANYYDYVKTVFKISGNGDFPPAANRFSPTMPPITASARPRLWNA